MSAQPFFFALAGGLDQQTPAVSIDPGRAIATLNHEATSTGYARTQGYERFDGRPAPSTVAFFVGTFSQGSANMVGMAVEGATSGATGIVIDVVVSSGSIGAGTAAGQIILGEMTGIFSVNEYLMSPGDVAVARVVSPPAEGDRLQDAQSMTWWKAARERRRNQIVAAPGSGAVRGVLWYEGSLYAWRDNSDATLGIMHKATSAGWQAVSLGQQINFSAAGPSAIEPGDVITGDISGATGVVRSALFDSADGWDTGKATGKIIYDETAGVFQAGETISVGPTLAIATLDSMEDVVFPAGGRYEFVVHNFYGTVGFERAYGVNGVGQGFDFDGDNVGFINTGMPDDTPFLIAEHKKQLFYGFRKGSLQNSALGEPRVWDAILGAAEMGMGKELTNLVPNTADAMFITTEGSCHVLTGNDASDFLVQDISQEAGARPFTAQAIGNIVYMDEEGIRSASSTQTYGNFRLGTYTALIEKTLNAKRKGGVKPVASIVVKSKSQYLLFFEDGTGISLFMARKTPEAMIFEYPFVVSCHCTARVDGDERVFVGSTDGMVYELNVGTSFDGDVIEAMVQLPYGHQGSPRVLKRYHKIIIEMEAGPDTRIAVVPQFDYSNGFQSLTLSQWFDMRGGGGAWGASTWGDFYWDSPEVARAECPMDGSGESMSPVIFSSSDSMEDYTLTGVWVMYSGRGMKR